MHLLANENFPMASVLLLRQAGFDVLAIAEYQPGISDREIFLLAAMQERIIITFDRDYGELVYKYKEIPPIGIIYLRFIPKKATEAGEYILKLLNNKEIILQHKFTVCEATRVRQNSLIKESSII